MPQSRTKLITSSAAAFMAGALIVLLAKTAIAGPITPGAITRSSIYQGVLSIVQSGNVAMEIGNAGRDIAGTSDLYFRPGANISGAQFYTRMFNVGGLTFLNVPGRVGIGQSSQTTPNSKLLINNGVVAAQAGDVNNTIDAFNNVNAGSAIYAQQDNAGGFAGYFSGLVRVASSANPLTLGSTVVGGSEIASTGVINIEPTSATVTNFAQFFHNALYGTNAASLSIPGAICLNGTCITNWTSAGSISGGGAANRATIWTGGSTLSYNDNFVWDNGNSRLGIAQTAPGAKVAVNNPTTAGRVGATGDALYAYAGTTNAAVSGEQGNANGWAGYFSGRVQAGSTRVIASPDAVITGTVDPNGTTILAGQVGVSRFLSELTVGDRLTIAAAGAPTRIVVAIANDISLTMNTLVTDSAPVPATRRPAILTAGSATSTALVLSNSLNVGINQPDPGAKLAVNYYSSSPVTPKRGSPGDAVYAFADAGSGAAISAEQANPVAWAGYFSGRLNVSGGQICFNEFDCQSSWPAVGGGESLDQTLAIDNTSNRSIILGNNAAVAYIANNQTVTNESWIATSTNYPTVALNQVNGSYAFMVPLLGSGSYNALSQVNDSGLFFNNTKGLVLGSWQPGGVLKGARLTGGAVANAALAVNNNLAGTGGANDAIAAYANAGSPSSAVYGEQNNVSGYAGYFSNTQANGLAGGFRGRVTLENGANTITLGELNKEVTSTGNVYVRPNSALIADATANFARFFSQDPDGAGPLIAQTGFSSPWICLGGDCKNTWPSSGGTVGPGTPNTLAKFTGIGGDTVGDSVISESGGNVDITQSRLRTTTAPQFPLSGTASSDGTTTLITGDLNTKFDVEVSPGDTLIVFAGPAPAPAQACSGTVASVTDFQNLNLSSVCPASFSGQVPLLTPSIANFRDTSGASRFTLDPLGKVALGGATYPHGASLLVGNPPNTSSSSTIFSQNSTGNSAWQWNSYNDGSSGSGQNGTLGLNLHNSSITTNNWSRLAFSTRTSGAVSARNVVGAMIATNFVSRDAANGWVQGDLAFFTNPSGAAGGIAERMRILGNGNVGIGTTAAGSLFQVTQPTTGPGTVNISNVSDIPPALPSTVTGTSTVFTSTFKVGDNITVGGEPQTIISIASDTSMTVDEPFTLAGPASNQAYTLIGGNRFYVRGNGNVAVGNSNPIGKFVINNNVIEAGHYGSSGDAIAAYTDSTNSAVYAQQDNTSGYAGYFSGQVDLQYGSGAPAWNSLDAVRIYSNKNAGQSLHVQAGGIGGGAARFDGYTVISSSSGSGGPSWPAFSNPASLQVATQVPSGPWAIGIYTNTTGITNLNVSGGIIGNLIKINDNSDASKFSYGILVEATGRSGNTYAAAFHGRVGKKGASNSCASVAEPMRTNCTSGYGYEVTAFAQSTGVDGTGYNTCTEACQSRGLSCVYAWQNGAAGNGVAAAIVGACDADGNIARNCLCI